MSSFPRSFSLEQARKIGQAIGIDWAQSPFDAEQFRMGLEGMMTPNERARSLALNSPAPHSPCMRPDQPGRPKCPTHIRKDGTARVGFPLPRLKT